MQMGRLLAVIFLARCIQPLEVIALGGQDFAEQWLRVLAGHFVGQIEQAAMQRQLLVLG